jgi:hypothetical protein
MNQAVDWERGRLGRNEREARKLNWACLDFRVNIDPRNNTKEHETVLDSFGPLGHKQLQAIISLRKEISNA